MNRILLVIIIFLGFHQLYAQTSVYIRGTGHNYSALRQVKLNGNLVVNIGGRGLCLTIIDASTHQHISSTVYDTYGSTTASNNLASALNDLQRGYIGILTSYDAWCYRVTQELRNAAERLGLYKLAGGLELQSRRPYAAIFRGSGTATGNTEPNHIAYEVMQSNDNDAERAVIATWLIEDAFIGNNLTNALIYGDGAQKGAALLVNHLGDIGIGTTNPDSKLTVKGDVHAEEVKIDLSVPAPDYVFKEDYVLRDLKELQEYIKKHGHLPNIPSAKEMEANGVELGTMNMKLLEKIEELVLYTLQQEEKLADKEERIQNLEKRLERLETLMNSKL